MHVPALDSTKGMIGKDALGLMKEGVIVLNFARDVLVDSEAMVDALVAGKVKHYVTSAILAKDNMNIADLTNKSKGKYAYTMIDVDSEVPDGVVEELKQIGEVLRVRVIC